MHLSARLQRLRTLYLNLAATHGGTKSGYQDFVLDYFATHPGEWDADGALREAAAKAWEKKKESDDDIGDMFEIAGRPLPDALTYPDPAAPDQYRKIARKYATIHHGREDAILTMRNGATISAAGAIKMKMIDEALKRAGGNPAALLSSVKD